MPDVFTKAKRSDVMSRIRSRGNADTELALAKLLRAHKIRGWRRQVRLQVPSGKWRVAGKSRSPVTSRDTRRPSLTVTPDFVFLKQRVTVFVDGCFWHGCPKHGTKPKGNAAFWRKKFAANKAGDARVNRALRRAGWRVIRIWEHELRQSGKRKAKSGKTKASTPHPKPSPPAPLPSDGRGWRRDLPVRGGEGVRRGTSPVVRRIQQAIAGR